MNERPGNVGVYEWEDLGTGGTQEWVDTWVEGSRNEVSWEGCMGSEIPREKVRDAF